MPEFDRDLLDAWDDPEVPDGFADRVLEAQSRASAGPTPWSVWAAVAALVMVGGLAVFAPETAAPPPTLDDVPPMAVLSGSVTGEAPAIQCTGPDEVDFADRGRARLGEAAVLEWSLDDEARLKVHQRTGNVSYDLPVGETVLLTTPGEVEALELEGRFEVDLEEGAERSISAY